MSIFNGVATALVTPFKYGEVDFSSLDKLLSTQLDNGINALVVNGTTGEPATMSHTERVQVIKFVISRVGHQIPVIVGAGSNCTATAVEYAKEAESLGADAILSVTPYYNKCTQNGLIEHFKTIADNVNIPVILYNVPGRTGVNILSDTIARLAGYENIVAVKEASGNVEQAIEAARLSEGKIDIYSGDDGLTLPIMTAAGGKGVISVASNVIPREMVALTQAIADGKIEEARRIQFEIAPLVKALFAEVNPIPAKYALSLLGICHNELRLPLTPMEKTDLIKNALTGLGYEV